MNTNICSCNKNNDISNEKPKNTCCQNSCLPTVDQTFKKLNIDLCNMKVTLAESRANLIFLAQTLCNAHYMNETEKMLLLNLEQEIKKLNATVNDCKCNLDYLEDSYFK